MSTWRYAGFGNAQAGKSERNRELYRRANENLKKVGDGVYRRQASEKREAKKTELEQAFAWEIQLGHDVLERRALNKELNRLLTMKRDMTSEEQGAAEELQSMIDRYDEQLTDYGRDEQSRFVRLWNKSRKARYKL
jgi:hypothetical protein